MSRRSWIALGALTACLVAGIRILSGVEFKTAILRNEIVWQIDYATAYKRAKQERKLLVLYFDPHPQVRTAGAEVGETTDPVDRVLTQMQNRDHIDDFVFARLPMDVTAED